MLRRVHVADGADLAGFRRATRLLVAARVPPQAVAWSVGSVSDLLGTSTDDAAPPLALPRAVRDAVSLGICHRDPQRHALLYSLIWRVLNGERALLEVHSDPLVHRIAAMVKAVRRDLHKMHAFVRFRQVEAADGERFVAWFEPDHFILEAAAPFFIDRFRSMAWSILTPIGSLHWDRACLAVGPPAVQGDAPTGDAYEAGWRGYYESTFNPARVNPKAMTAEMPRKYWRNLPETQAVADLVRSAEAQARAMIEREAAMPRKRNPDKAVVAMADQDPATLDELNRIIAASAPLVPGATRAVLGEGPVGAAVAFVGEQPGDQEDLQGRPFVGPAGQLLDRALAEAGLDRRAAYVTNAVKHFKFEQRGKKRIHQRPTAGEVKHYRWWLMRELAFVSPRMVVAMGATAVFALAGKALPITRARGPIAFDPWPGYVTVHPSYLLRLPDAAAREQGYADFVRDLKRVRALAMPEADLPARGRATG